MSLSLAANSSCNYAGKKEDKSLPAWFKQPIPDEKTLKTADCLRNFQVHTVCQEARCPNLGVCFRDKKFTFMILGDTCTRSCRFCSVKKGRNNKLPLDRDEPYRLARVAEALNLNYVVITSVARDDFPDGGSAAFAEVIKLLRARIKDIQIEVLIPDFKGSISGLKCVLEAEPLVVAHNLETVKRLYPDLRPQADYGLSLGILRKTKELAGHITTKSSLMLGLGETEKEVIAVMQDLRYNLCDILTLGQYLAPSPEHYPVKEFIKPEQFQAYRDIGLALGFKAVFSGPLVRSSYQAEELFKVSIL